VCCLCCWFAFKREGTGVVDNGGTYCERIRRDRRLVVSRGIGQTKALVPRPMRTSVRSLYNTQRRVVRWLAPCHELRGGSRGLQLLHRSGGGGMGMRAVRVEFVTPPCRWGGLSDAMGDWLYGSRNKRAVALAGGGRRGGWWARGRGCSWWSDEAAKM
jgi:hypothetical protein